MAGLGLVRFWNNFSELASAQAELANQQVRGHWSSGVRAPRVGGDGGPEFGDEQASESGAAVEGCESGLAQREAVIGKGTDGEPGEQGE